jgi:hypothetical protein
MSESGSRAWVGRAALEAGLIVFGLVGALLVDEWRDTRQREARRDTALTSVREELRANRESLDRAIANHETVTGRLRESAKTGVRYNGGLFNAPQLSTVAWQTARDAAVTADIDHATLVAIGHAYNALDVHSAERTVFLNFLYTGGVDIRNNPLGLAGWLSDMTLHARGVQQRIDDALQALGSPQGAG